MPDILTDEQIAELERLHRLAVTQQWSVEVEEYGSSGCVTVNGLERILHDTDWADPEEFKVDQDKAHWIADISNAFPALLRRLREAEREREERTTMAVEQSAAAWQALAEEYRAALEKHPCRCSMALKNACPTCGETLIAVRYSGYLNSDQWDAIKGGDWYCNTCTDQSIVNGKKHWHDRELQSITYQQCDRCFAITSTTPADALARRDERMRALGAADYLEAAAVKRWTLPYNVMHAEAAALRKKAGE